MPDRHAVSLPANARCRVAFLLLPGFSLLAHACALEPLHMANQLSGRMLYLTRTVGLEAAAVRSAGQLELATPEGLETPPGDIDMLLVCAPTPLSYPLPARLNDWLRRLDSRRVLLGGIAGGTEVLARCGLLEGYRATLPWPRFGAFRQAYPEVALSRQRYELDRRRLTCGAGTAALDMMLELVALTHGAGLAGEVSEHLAGERSRAAEEHQQAARQNGIGYAPESLRDAVALMEANVEEPLSTLELAEYLGISRRQLERLFKKHLQAVPSRYYLDLRLQRARRLLRKSERPVGDIALATGFSSGAHFSTAYRQRFGIAPREERLL
ncbi:GlxA family transcriptional regulator [Halomonas piscis]|uniref:GlxA family transcriptional regulator n=1 Tax=Halomonas piscis TaxID=3031727 RepID=A0ABY9Z424_9GAMM|nr:GlxA family transcriptional regulator [Halomonas piscis]WNK21028.1 GlxA family transcriptional regulator [Halomonas piscis]